MLRHRKGDEEGAAIRGASLTAKQAVQWPRLVLDLLLAWRTCCWRASSL